MCLPCLAAVAEGHVGRTLVEREVDWDGIAPGERRATSWAGDREGSTGDKEGLAVRRGYRRRLQCHGDGGTQSLEDLREDLQMTGTVDGGGLHV